MRFAGSPVARCRRGGGDSGFTTVELLVVIGILGLLMAMVTSSVLTAMQSQRRQLERLEALNEVKTAFHRVTRDVRAADPLLGPLEAQRLGTTVVRGGEVRTVTFEFDGDAMVMQESSASSAFTHTLATGLDPGAGIFRYFDAFGNEMAPPIIVSNVTTVEITLRRVLPEENDIEFRDRITVRNSRR